MSHSAEKCKSGTLLELLTYILLQNFKKREGGPFGDMKKFSKKVAQCRKKSKEGTLLVPSCFVGYLEKINTEAKRCFATHDEDESWLDECRKIVYIQSHAYIFNSPTLFNNVPMAQWSTLMPSNREAAGSNLSGVLAFV